MDAAMKLARQYFLEISPPQQSRTRFIARKQSYHGITLGPLSLGGHTIRRKNFEPMLMDNCSHVSPCYAYRGKTDGESDESYVARLAQELDDEFQRVGPETVCAFVAEPVVGAALGCVPYVPGYFKAMKAVCDRYGALLIMDEVMCGMGRSGPIHAWQDPEVGVVPDIQTMGKGLGGGYVPIAGVLVGSKVVRAFESGSGAFVHGQTYQGHPVACAAALAVQKEIKERGLVQNTMRMGKLLEKELRSRLEDNPFVGEIRGRGLFWGVSSPLLTIIQDVRILVDYDPVFCFQWSWYFSRANNAQIEFVKDKATKEPFDPKLGVGMGLHEKGTEKKPCHSAY